jgi:hypothetical protein
MSPFHRMQFGREGCVPFYRQQYGRAGSTPFLNAGMSYCPASDQSGARMNQMQPGTSLVPECFVTEQIQNARMTLPSYASDQVISTL